MNTLLWILISLVSGSIPFSVWLGQLFLKKDVREFGDGNPGATNVFRAGSPSLGVLVLLLDVAKAALPIGICYHWLGFRGGGLFFIAVAPLLGHMYSPFLGFRGGKALAAALGVWIGLTLWQASLPAVIGVIIGILVLNNSGWAVMLAMLAILISLLINPQDPLFLGVWLLQTLLLAWTHRQDLSQSPRFSSRIKKTSQSVED